MIATPISRRSLLAAAGTTLLSASGGLGRSIPLAVQRVSVRDFGAQGDGVTDDRPAFQRAVDHLHARGGGRLDVPALDRAGGRYYRLRLPILLRSGVEIVGEGEDSALYNDHPHSVLFGDSFVVLPGNYHPAFTQELPFKRAEPAVFGATSLTLGRPFHPARFTPGTTVALRTREMTRTYDGFEDLLWHRLNEVVASDPGAGRIALKYPFDRDLPGGLEIAEPDTTAVRYRPRPAALEDEPLFVAKRAALRNLYLRSNGPVMGDSATFECLFQDLWIRGYRGLYGNLFCHSRFERIRCEVGIQVIEASQNSHDTLFRDITAEVKHWGGENFQLVTFNEAAARVVLDGFRIMAGPWAATSPALRFGPGAQDCVIRNGFLDAPNAGGGLVGMEVGPVAPGEDQRYTRDCGFENIVCTGGTATTNAIICEVGDPSYLVDCWFKRLRFSGNYLRAGRIAGSRTRVEDCVWDNPHAPLQVLPNARACRIVDNVIPGGIEMIARPGSDPQHTLPGNRLG